ncbi:hypothetical protein [Kaistia sp. MMO-174]|uniref:hypothetical protein n=1 Tax=Kaistia sp. MMO-174 TaxID=3081256 RepID=UPI00301A1CB5
MGITSLALQCLTVAALRGATLAGDAVQFGAIDALDVNAALLAKPLIAVFLGEDDRTLQGRELVGGEHRVELLIQAFLPAEIDITIDGSPLTISSRQGGADVIMSIVRRQIDAALAASDSDAASLWRILVAQIESTSAIPFLFQINDQVRVAANEASYMCRLGIFEPSFGKAVESDFWRAVIGTISEDPDLAPLAAWIEGEIRGPQELPSWRVAQADLGLTQEGREAIGIGPIVLPEAPSSEAPPISEAVVDTGDGETWRLP